VDVSNAREQVVLDLQRERKQPSGKENRDRIAGQLTWKFRPPTTYSQILECGLQLHDVRIYKSNSEKHTAKKGQANKKANLHFGPVHVLVGVPDVLLSVVAAQQQHEQDRQTDGQH
jgi:hypothetical protein